MILDIKRLADRILPFGTADAHCDVPCGIYDPRDAIQADGDPHDRADRKAWRTHDCGSPQLFRPLRCGEGRARIEGQGRHPGHLDGLLQARARCKVA